MQIFNMSLADADGTKAECLQTAVSVTGRVLEQTKC